MAENPTREYIKESFKNFYTVLKSKFIKSADIVKTCTSTSDALPLAASQGKALSDKITALDKAVNANNVLYNVEAGHLLFPGHAAALSGKISDQKHGIILVFALRRKNDSGTDVANTNYHTFYIPKSLVGSSYDASGIDSYGRIFVKHIYLNDQKISAEADGDQCSCNKYSGTVSGTYGTWVSDSYALRYVIGV